MSRKATWTEERRESGRRWRGRDGWCIFDTSQGFALCDLDDGKEYGTYRKLAHAIEAAEAIDAMPETARQPAPWAVNATVHHPTTYIVVYRVQSPCGPVTAMAPFTLWESARWFIERQLPALGCELVKVVFR